MPTNYQEPIEKEDLDLKGKVFSGEVKAGQRENVPEKPEISKEQGEKSFPETPRIEKNPSPEQEAPKDAKEGQVSEKIETVRKTITTAAPSAQKSVSDDAGTISQISEHEKKVEKLVELALQKGPEHAIRVAQHMDKGKATGETDNYTLDEIHDQLMVEELRKQLMQKGLLKEI